MCIRGVYASASLKLGVTQGRFTGEPLHPRCLRLGLIEATTPRSGSCLPRCIRGVYASASLKRSARKRGYRERRRIRGVYASASLKPERFLRAVDRDEAHPRCLRLGLIEALEYLQLLGQGDEHPRCLRLGLIEAPHSTRRCALCGHASEVFTPRPH